MTLFSYMRDVGKKKNYCWHNTVYYYGHYGYLIGIHSTDVSIWLPSKLDAITLVTY